MPDLKTAALKYADAGIAVFPLRPRGKAPITTNGVLDATTDSAQVAEWWSKTPDANIGIGLGASGLVVADIDPRNGGSLGSPALSGIPRDLVALTGGGGFHIYMRADPEARYPGKLAEGIDLKHGNGYVVASPSVHESGNAYKWHKVGKPPAAPQRLAELAPAARPELTDSGDDDPIAPGAQGETLFSLAVRWYEKGHTPAEVRALLGDAVARRCLDQDPANPWRDHDLAKIATSANRYGDKLLRAIESGKLTVKASDPEPDYAPAPAAERRKLRLYTSAELAEIPAAEMLLDDVLVRRGFNVLAGPSGGGKSFMAIDWACRVADKGGRVVYVMAEGAGGAFKRVRAWSYAHKGVKAELPAVEWIVQSFDVMVDTPELLDLAGPRDLVIFDTLHRVTPGIDENSSTEVGRVIQAVDYVRETSGAATLLVHHSGWNDERERGSSALRGAADAFTHLRPVKGDEYGILELRCTKLKDAEQWAPRHYKLRSGGILGESAYVIEADPPQVEGQLDLDSKIIDYLTEAGESSTQRIIDNVTGSTERIRSALKDMQGRGKVTCRELGNSAGKRWSVTPPGGVTPQ